MVGQSLWLGLIYASYTFGCSHFFKQGTSGIHLNYYEASLFDKNYVAFGMSQIRAQRCVVGNMI